MLIIYQELAVMPLHIQWIHYYDVLIEFDSEVDMRVGSAETIRMEWWMGAHLTLSVSPVAMKKGFGSSGDVNGQPSG